MSGTTEIDNEVHTIFLLGYMASGKSTLGSQLARQLDWEFLDTDALISKNENKSIDQIFSECGEAYFRKLETEFLHRYKTEKNIVVSTGGGMPCSENNIQNIKTKGISFYLYLKSEELTQRLWDERNARPLVKNIANKSLLQDFITTSLHEREAFYFRADYIIDASMPVTEQCDHIRSLLHFLP